MAKGPIDPRVSVPGDPAVPAHVPRNPATGAPHLLVRAVKRGFYADPGSIRQKERAPGDVFQLRHVREFAGVEEHPVGGWMEWAHLPSEFLDQSQVPITTAPQLIADPLRMTQANNRTLEVPSHPSAPQQSFAPAAPVAGSQVPGTVPAQVQNQGGPAWPVENPSLPGTPDTL